MLALAEIQTVIRDALVTGRAGGVSALLAGGADPERRLAIHQRHYATSLTRALVERFPATVWLVGSDFVTDAAASFVRECPPTKPCIAEYGDAFPGHLAARPAAASLPYLAQFAALEWHFGRLALAADDGPAVHHAHLDWSIDELLACYLSDAIPGQFSLRQEDVWLEIEGLRGELQMRRLTPAAFARRSGARQEDDL